MTSSCFLSDVQCPNHQAGCHTPVAQRQDKTLHPEAALWLLLLHPQKRKRKPKPLADVDVGTAPDFPPEPDEEEAPATPGSGGVPAAAESGPAAAAAAGLRLEDIPGIRVESLEETEARLADGSVKQVLFRVRVACLLHAKKSATPQCGFLGWRLM